MSNDLTEIDRAKIFVLDITLVCNRDMGVWYCKRNKDDKYLRAHKYLSTDQFATPPSKLYDFRPSNMVDLAARMMNDDEYWY